MPIWIDLFMSAACFAGGAQLKRVLSCCLALALLMGGLILKHVERSHRGGTSQTPLSSWGAVPTPRVPATQAVGDGRDRPAFILIPVVCCMLWWMLLGGRTGLCIVTCPLWPTLAKCIRLGLLVSLLTRFHRPPCPRTTCLVDIA